MSWPVILTYKWWWTRILGRPWTFVFRDMRQKYPLPWMICLSTVMILIGHFFWSWELLWISFGLSIGILVGHIWFGTKYIPDQKGK